MILKGLATLALATLTTLQVQAQEKAADIGELFSKGTYDAKFRLGYEYSDFEDNGAAPGKGLSLSSYIGYRTAELSGLSFYAQFHNMWKIDDKYNDTQGKYAGEYDVIADPDGNRMQQYYADFTGISDTQIRIGRQEILLDDIRFIGSIGWRNTAQAFDAIKLTNKSIKDTTLTLVYSEKVANIFNEEVDYDGIVMANAKYTGMEGHTQTLFAYLVDADTSETSASTKRDTATYGIRLTHDLDDFLFDFTYAHQTDYQDSKDVDVNFMLTSLAYKMGDFTPAIGYSFIEGSDKAGGQAFDTLFSTAHKFNGWSDQFISTNAGNLRDGLQDYNASLTYKQWDTTFKLVYHYFDTTESHTYDDDYGQELDFLIARKINKYCKASAKFAYYDASSDRENFGGTASKDEFVLWLRLDFKIGAPISDPLNY